MVRSRFEAVENYFDLQDNQNSDDPQDDAFSFWHYRVVVGMNAELADNVKAEVQLQGFGHFGSEYPIKGIWAPPLQAEDIGDPNGYSDVNVYTASVEVSKIADSNFSFAVGRMEHTYGTELFLGNYDFYNGTSYDGAKAWWAGENFTLAGLYFKTYEGNVTSAQDGVAPGDFANGGSYDGNLWGLTFDYSIANNKWGTAGAHYLSDQILFLDGKVDTYGFRWAPMPNVDNGAIDWNIEAAFQSGDLGDPLGGSPGLDLSGSVIEGWFSWSFKHGNSNSRVNVGYWTSSGDDQSTTNEDEGFISLFGDFHAYNRLGDPRNRLSRLFSSHLR